MHPAPSIIAFTTFSGLGFGLLVWLGIDPTPPRGWVGFVFFLIAYLMAVGGAAYLVSQGIKKSKVVGFPELGMEAIYEFDVKDMPVTVAVDYLGESVHKTGPAKWQEIIMQEAS